MKRIFLIAALLLPLTATAKDYCLEVSDAAKAVMHNRLTGIEEYRQLDLADDILDGEELAVMRELIKDAYIQPASLDRPRAERDFAFTWLIKCSRNEKGWQ
jgi:hypothetical protein